MTSDLTFLGQYIITRSRGFLICGTQEDGATLLDVTIPQLLRVKVTADIPDLREQVECVCARAPARRHAVPDASLWWPGVTAHPLLRQLDPEGITAVLSSTGSLITNFEGGVTVRRHVLRGLQYFFPLMIHTEKLPRCDEERSEPTANKTYVLECTPEHIFALRLYQRADGALCVRGSVGEDDQLVIPDPPDVVKLIFEVDTASLTARIYPDTSAPGAPANGPPRPADAARSARRVPRRVDTGTTGTLGRLVGRASVVNPL